VRPPGLNLQVRCEWVAFRPHQRHTKGGKDKRDKNECQQKRKCYPGDEFVAPPKAREPRNLPLPLVFCATCAVCCSDLNLLVLLFGKTTLELLSLVCSQWHSPAGSVQLQRYTHRLQAATATARQYATFCRSRDREVDTQSSALPLNPTPDED
jgi:hypothetical protein